MTPYNLYPGGDAATLWMIGITTIALAYLHIAQAIWIKTPSVALMFSS
ncbi:MAG: hypothetical protein F6J95_002435 [Leptolyngbya sp. SIO1E4]|nr:hypothetical protein [Leptolyngbya sp. SIO1E4]